MSTFHYIVHATTGDNVGEISADNDKDALAKLDEIFQPDKTSKASPHISIELITKQKHDSEKKRIDDDRLKEANAVPEE